VKQAKTAAAKAHADVAVIEKSLQTVKDNQDKLVTGAEARYGKPGARHGKPGAGDREAAAGHGAEPGGRRQGTGARGNRADRGDHQRAASSGTVAAARSDLEARAAPGDARRDQRRSGRSSGGTGAARRRRGATRHGKAQIAAGKAQLATGASALRKARKQLEKAEDVLGHVADGQDILIDVAKYRVKQATLYAPVSGVVTQARTAGTVAMVGAPLVRIVPDAPRRSTRTCSRSAPRRQRRRLGDRELRLEHERASAGRVTQIAPQAQFPPTSFPTSIVHMTNTVQIQVTLDNGAWAPPGTPVDLTIATNGH